MNMIQYDHWYCTVQHCITVVQHRVRQMCVSNLKPQQWASRLPCEDRPCFHVLLVQQRRSLGVATLCHGFKRETWDLMVCYMTWEVDIPNLKRRCCTAEIHWKAGMICFKQRSRTHRFRFVWIAGLLLNLWNPLYRATKSLPPATGEPLFSHIRDPTINHQGQFLSCRKTPHTPRIVLEYSETGIRYVLDNLNSSSSLLLLVNLLAGWIKKDCQYWFNEFFSFSTRGSNTIHPRSASFPQFSSML